ncbi:MAG: hypothetical protein H0W14_11305, partial [Actinobacteria bacterium]|nr:hypothetical protein [Actinomycetota bacterium]
ALEDSETVGVVASVLIGLIGYSWVYAALIATLARRTRSPLEPYGRTVDRLPALALANLTAGLATVLGLLLLIVPGLLLAARWSTAGPLIVLEHKGPFEALETSNGLIRGRTWPVVRAGLAVVLFSAVLALPGGVIAEVAESPWTRGLGNALLDLALYVPTAALSFATYRQARATPAP